MEFSVLKERWIASKPRMNRRSTVKNRISDDQDNESCHELIVPAMRSLLLWAASLHDRANARPPFQRRSEERMNAGSGISSCFIFIVFSGILLFLSTVGQYKRKKKKRIVANSYWKKRRFQRKMQENEERELPHNHIFSFPVIHFQHFSIDDRDVGEDWYGQGSSLRQQVFILNITWISTQLLAIT